MIGLNATLADGSQYVIYKPISPKHVAFHESTVPNLITIGSRGSGKSILLRNDAHMRALSVPNANLVLIRNTFRDLFSNHIIYLKQEMKLLGGDYHQSNNIAYYPNGSRLFLGYVGDEGLSQLGAEFIAAYFDELSVIPWEFFLKIAASVRVAGAFKEAGVLAVIRAATNPLGQSTEEIMRFFVDKDVDPAEFPDYNPAEWDNIQINMEDNPTLDIKQYRQRFSGFAPHIRKAWLEGVFSPEHGIFDFTPTKDGKPYHLINNIDLPKLISASSIYRAIDAGWYPDPTVCLWIAHLGNRYIVFHEKHWHKTVATDIAKDIKQVEENLGITKIAGSYCDPSMDINTTADVRSVKDIYEANGIPLDCSINDREQFALAINTALTEEAEDGVPRLQIYADGKQGAFWLAKTLPQQRFDDKHPERMANHKNDHWTVALAYFLMSQASGERHSISSPRTLRPWMRPKKGEGNELTLGRENVRSHY